MERFKSSPFTFQMWILSSREGKGIAPGRTVNQWLGEGVNPSLLISTWGSVHHTTVPSVCKILHSKLFNPGAVSSQETEGEAYYLILCGFGLGLKFSFFCPSVWMDEALYGRELLSSRRPGEMVQSELLYKKRDNTFSRGKVFVSTYWNLSTLTDTVVLTWRCTSRN